MDTTCGKLSAFVVIAMTLMPGCEDARREPTEQVTIRSQSWVVELADTANLRYRGLSDRKALPAGRGMLFMYPNPQRLDFCMRQCLIPLDIAFIGPDMRVVRIYTMEVEPYGLNEKEYTSGVPAQYALEVPKGALLAAGVQVGDLVEFSANMPPAAKAEYGP